MFSSTAAVYGEPHTSPIPESHPLAPINPYGAGKMVVERILADSHAAGGPAFCALRYFNAAGADPDGELRENHRPETHLIPLAIDAALGKSPEISLFGTDYPTEDGTCVRDYAHVADIADAHVLALKRVLEGGEPLVANLGAGTGVSVRDVLSAVATVTGRPVPVKTGPRRAGDPAVLVADPTRAKRELGWRPMRSDLTTVLQDAYRSRR
ncbi:MAG: UDP-glucose 4-epimerase GalE [Bauldia litoralis]